MKEGVKYFMVVFLVLAFFNEGSALCSFGTSIGGKSFNVIPGQNVTVPIYFYNLYSDSTNHVTLFADVIPDGWSVDFDPSLRDVVYEIPGGERIYEENLGLVVKGKISSVDGVKEEGYEYIFDPSSKDTLIPAKKINVIISVPLDAELWESYGINLQATSSCSDSAGGVSAVQNRDFKISVTPIVLEYYETLKIDKYLFFKQNKQFLSSVLILFVVLLGIYLLIKKEILVLNFSGKKGLSERKSKK